MPTNPISPSKRHLPSLDGLRGIAILMVLATHLQTSGIIPKSSGWFNALTSTMKPGWVGVDLFFVLSGFLITGILLDTKHRLGRARVFYARRALRIFPLFYLAVFIGIGFTIFASHSSFVIGWFPRLKEWLLYLCYVQNWEIPFTSHIILGHFWSLGVEEQFYLLWPWCVWMVPTKWLHWVCLAGIVAAFFLRLALLHFLGADSAVVLTNTFCRMDTLLFGALCAISIRSEEWPEVTRRMIPLAAAIGVITMVLIEWPAHEAWSQGYWTQSVGYSALALGFSALLLTAYFQSGSQSGLDRMLKLPFLRFCGKYSYGLYVWHAPIFILAYVAFHHSAWWGKSLVAGATYAVGISAVSIAVAVLSYECYEKWFLRMKPDFERGNPSAPAPEAIVPAPEPSPL